MGINQISENLYVYEDTCNVYVLRSGTEATLIDFGDGGILDELGALGVTGIAAVLMTHHHRDQGQGLVRAAQAGIPIWVPHAEQDLFCDVDAHWQAREVYASYNSRQDRFSLLRSVPIAGALHDYSRRRCGDFDVTVLPTPGHSTGSITLLAEVDGRSVAFSGDLIYAPGKVWSMAATQWTYNGGEGLAASLASLLDLKTRRLEMLLPSHGRPMSDADAAIGLLASRLRELLQARGHNLRLAERRETPYVAMTPHLLYNQTSTANSYVLLSESGKALIIDYGYDFDTGMAPGFDRASRRPWLYTIGALKSQFNVSAISVAIPTHYHDDHVAGLNLLREVEGTQVWAAASYADILERPARHDLPCLWFDPIPVDRVLQLGQPVAWEEYELTLYPLPGHTLYAVAISFVVDGRRVLATGDQHHGEDGGHANYVYPNRFRIGDYAASVELYRRLNPDVILSGHWQPLWVQSGYFDGIQAQSEAIDRLHRALLPLDEVNLDAEGFAARIEPYQATIIAGKSLQLQIKVVNPSAHQEQATVRLIAPAAWRVTPATAVLDLRANATASVQFSVTPPQGVDVRRERVAADITVSGRRFGQQAEALLSVHSVPATDMRQRR